MNACPTAEQWQCPVLSPLHFILLPLLLLLLFRGLDRGNGRGFIRRGIGDHLFVSPSRRPDSAGFIRHVIRTSSSRSQVQLRMKGDLCIKCFGRRKTRRTSTVVSGEGGRKLDSVTTLHNLSSGGERTVGMNAPLLVGSVKG